jgi:hypothetical protein
VNAYTGIENRVLPSSLVWTRGLLYVGGVISVLANLGYLWSVGWSPEAAGQTVWSVWPGIAALFLARGLAGGGTVRFWLIVVVGGFWVLMGLGELGRGEPRGLTSLAIPIAILVTVTRPASRAFLLRSASY